LLFLLVVVVVVVVVFVVGDDILNPNAPPCVLFQPSPHSELHPQ